MKEKLDISEERDGFAVAPQPAPMTRSHTHEELELNLVMHGAAAYLLDDRRYDLRRHMLVWLFPGQEHLFLDRSPDYRAWILVFKPALLRRVCRTPDSGSLLESDPPGQFSKRLSSEQALRLDALFARIASSENHDLFNAGLGYALLAAWEAYRAAEDAPPGVTVHPGVEQAIRLLQEEADAETVETLARRVGLSASHLSRLFIRQAGTSLTDFRNKQRLERFFCLARSGAGVSLGQAALDAGFGSYAQFYAVFRQRMGCGPAEYLRRPRGESSPAPPPAASAAGL